MARLESGYIEHAERKFSPDSYLFVGTSLADSKAQDPGKSLNNYSFVNGENLPVTFKSKIIGDNKKIKMIPISDTVTAYTYGKSEIEFFSSKNSVAMQIDGLIKEVRVLKSGSIFIGTDKVLYIFPAKFYEDSKITEQFKPTLEH